MCLNVVTYRCEPDEEPKGKGRGYVVRHMNRRHLVSIFHHNHEDYHIGHWYEDDSNEFIGEYSLSLSIPYHRGFHIWTSKNAAKQYKKYINAAKQYRIDDDVVVRVSWEGMWAKGIQMLTPIRFGGPTQGTVIVAKYIRHDKVMENP